MENGKYIISGVGQRPFELILPSASPLPLLYGFGKHILHGL